MVAVSKSNKHQERLAVKPLNRGHWLVKFAPFRTSWQEIVRRGTFTLRGVRSHAARKQLAGMRLGDFCPDFFNREPRQPREQNNQFLFSRKADAVKAGRVIRPLRIAEMEETVGEGHVGQ